ncbi:MAG: hypothetical protein KGM16_08850 [Bacteroidota bacterium]|nr:hypothetical protein [Bacteroidota bacterium]
MKPSTKKINIDYPEIPFDEQSQPVISLILPYDSKMKKQPELFNFMTARADKIEEELLIKYPKEKVVPVVNKLRHLIKGMKCRADGKTVGIFVSPFAEKIYYFTPSHLDDHELPVLVQREEVFNIIRTNN